VSVAELRVAMKRIEAVGTLAEVEELLERLTTEEAGRLK
jgi:Ca2+-binding EF-hand superfamily protein